MAIEIRNLSSTYVRPMVLSHQPIRFETAQSWNRGVGNENHHGTGNNGINYPLPPDSNPKSNKGGNSKFPS